MGHSNLKNYGTLEIYRLLHTMTYIKTTECFFSEDDLLTCKNQQKHTQ